MNRVFKMILVIILFMLCPTHDFAEAATKKKHKSVAKLINVVIDAGHGGKDSGAISTRNRYEKVLTLNIAKMVRSILLRVPEIHPVMTRSNDQFITLAKRAQFAKQVGASLFVSIHGNSSKKRSLHGTETYYLKKDSRKLALTVHKSMIRTVKSTDRHVLRANDYVLRNNSVPAILIELGYMSNKKEEATLYSSKTQQKFARAIADGIIAYVNANQ